MHKLLLLLIAVFGFATELEVRLTTASSLKPIYVTGESPAREKLVFDFNTGGFLTVLPARQEWEQANELALWKREKVAYVLSVENAQATLIDVEKNKTWRYQDLSPHRLADQIHADLFGQEGIASLRLIYSERKKIGQQWQSEIWMQDIDGSQTKQLTFERAYSVTPSFYPHTAGMADPPFFFVSYKGGQSKIYHATPAQKPEPLIELRGNQLLPAIHRRGQKMAFISDAAGRADLFLQTFSKQREALGKPQQLFSAPRATQASPTFNPEGTQIAFVSDKEGPPRIYVINLESKKPRPRLLTVKNRENTSPCWSPDGKKLAFSAKVDGVRQIWIYDFEAGEESPLTTGPENKENPAWAPDSLHLVFNTDHEESGQLFLIDLNVKKPIPISQGEGHKRFASWESR